MWREPKSNYVASDQVTPSIFNELAENEKHLYSKRCETYRKTGTTETQVNELLFVKDGDNYLPKTRSNGVVSNLPIKAEESNTANQLKDGWTALTPGTTVLPYGLYLIRVDIKDDSSGIGGYGTMFVDFIAMYSTSSTEFDLRSFELPASAVHYYIANGYEGAWNRAARVQVNGTVSNGFKVNLFISEQGGYGTTDTTGKQLYPNKLASTVSGVSYKIKYKRIM